MKPVRDADGLAFDRAIAGEILRRQAAWLARIVLHRRGDIAGDSALIEGARSVAGDCFKGVGKSGILAQIARRQRPSVRVEEIGVRLRGEAVRLDVRDLRGEAGGNGEAVAGESDGRLKQFGPGELAICLMDVLQGCEHARDANRKTACHGRLARQLLPVLIEKELRRGGFRRGLAPVDADERLGAGVPIKNVGAAADPRGMRLDERQHHLDGDPGICRAAAFAQDSEPRFGGKRVGCDDHMLLRLDERLRRKAARALRLLEGVSPRRGSARGLAQA